MQTVSPSGAVSQGTPDPADQPSEHDVFVPVSKFFVTRIPGPDAPKRIKEEWDSLSLNDKFLYAAYPCLPDFHASLFGPTVQCSLDLPNSPQALDRSRVISFFSESSPDSVIVSQGSSGAIMQGYLNKRPLFKGHNDSLQPSTFKPYKRRFFVLKNQQLIYYKAPPLSEHTKEVGKWSLTGAAISHQDKDTIQLKINNDTKAYLLKCVEGVNMKDWYDLLCSETNIKSDQNSSPAAAQSPLSPAGPATRPGSNVGGSPVTIPHRLPRAGSVYGASAISKSRSRRSESLTKMLLQKHNAKEVSANGPLLMQMLSNDQGAQYFEDIDVNLPTPPLLSFEPEPASNPIRFIIKPTQLSFKFFHENSDSFFFSIAIYDFDRRLKVSEDFTFMMAQPHAQSQKDHVLDMASWTMCNSTNEGVNLKFELPNLSPDNAHSAHDSQRGVFSISRLSPGLHVVVWISKQLQDVSAKVAEPFLISRPLTDSEKSAFNKKMRDRKKEWSPAFHQTFVWGSFPLFEKIKDHYHLRPSNTRKVERFYRVLGDVQNPFDIFKQMEYAMSPGSFSILPDTMKEVLQISAEFEILMPSKDVSFPTIGPDLQLCHAKWTGDAVGSPGLVALHSEICGGIIPREVLEFNQFGPPSEISTFVYIYPKALNLMSSVTEFNMNVVLKVTFKRDDSTTDEGDPAGSFFISRAWEADWKFFAFADTTVKSIQPLFHDELKASLPFPFKRGDHFLFSFYKVNLINKGWFSSKSNQAATFPAMGIPFHADTFSYKTIGHCIMPVAKLFSSSMSKGSFLSEDVLCDIGELPLYSELKPGYLSKLDERENPLSVVEQCMFSLSFRVVSPWCSLDSDVINYFGLTNVDLFITKRFDWMPDLPSSVRENLPEKQKSHILTICNLSRRAKPLECCKLFPVLLDSLFRNLYDLFSSVRTNLKLPVEGCDPNLLLAEALSTVKVLKSSPKSCSARGLAFAKGIQSDLLKDDAIQKQMQRMSSVRGSDDRNFMKFISLEQLLSTDAKRNVMTSECWEMMFSCVHLIQKTNQIRDGVAFKNIQGHDMLARQYLRSHFDVPIDRRKHDIASVPNMILFSLVCAIEYLIDQKQAEPSIIPLSEELKAERPSFASSWLERPPKIAVPNGSAKPNDVAIVSAMNMIAQSWFWLGSVLKGMVLICEHESHSRVVTHAFFQKSLTVDLIELLVISSSKFLSCITTCNMQRNFKDGGTEEKDMVFLLDEIELKDLANSLNGSLVGFLLDLFPILDTDFVNGCLDCYMDFELRKVNQEKLLQKADLRVRLDTIEQIVSFRMLMQYTKTQKLPDNLDFELVKLASQTLYPLVSLVMKEVEFYVFQKPEDIEPSCLARLCSLLLRLTTSLTADPRYQKKEISSVIAHTLISLVPIMIECEKSGIFFGNFIPETIDDGCCNENILVIVMFHVIEMFGFTSFAVLFTSAESDSVGAFCRLLTRYLRVMDSAKPIVSQSDNPSPHVASVVSENSDDVASVLLSSRSQKRVLALLDSMVVARQWNDAKLDHATFHHIWIVLMEILEHSTEELPGSVQFLQMMVGSIDSPGPARAMFFGEARDPLSSDGSSYACARWNEAVGNLARLAFSLDLSESQDDSSSHHSSTSVLLKQSSFLKGNKAIVTLAQDALSIFVAPYEQVEVPLPKLPDDYVAPDLARIDDSSADGEGEDVKSMTPAQIILSLSQYKTMPVTLLDEVLVTYRSYCQPLYLLQQLIDRYRQLSDLQDDDKLQKDKITVCQARVMNNLSKWITKYFHDWRPSPPLTSRLLLFLIDVQKKSKESKVSKLLCKELLQKHTLSTSSVSEHANWPEPVMPVVTQSSVFRFLLPAKKIETKSVDVLLHWAPIEVARQLSLIEASIFKMVQASEFMNQNWAKRPHLAPNIKSAQDRFNVVARWAGWQILQRNTVEERATVVEKLYEILLHLRDLQNYNSCLQIISGLGNAGVYRLKKTLALVKERDETRMEKGEKFWWGEKGLVAAFEDLKVDMAQTGNYKKMREIMEAANQEYCGLVPYLGIFQSDFTFLDEGSQTFNSPGRVNLKKVKLFASAIKKIKEFQGKTYSLHVVPQLRDSLVNLEKPTFEDDAKEEAAMYKRSLEVEPREAATTA